MPFFRKKQLGRREIVASRRQVSDSTVRDKSATTSQAFRRSRNVAQRPDIETSDRQELHVLKRRRRKIAIRLTLSLGVLLIAGGLLNQLTANIKVVTPNAGTGNSGIQQRYSDIFMQYLKDRPLERLRFMVNYDNLHAFLLEKTPEIQSAEIVAGDSIATSELRLSFRQPVLQWTSGNHKYFVDGQGVTFAQNYFDEPDIAVDDQSGVQPEAGQVVVNRNFLSFLGQVAAKFEENGTKVSRVVLPEDTVRQVEFGLEGRNSMIRMTVDRGVAEQTNRALKSLSWLDAQGLNPGYIDARVDQKIYYK